jgi:hypothetical protein
MICLLCCSPDFPRFDEGVATAQAALDGADEAVKVAKDVWIQADNLCKQGVAPSCPVAQTLLVALVKAEQLKQKMIAALKEVTKGPLKLAINTAQLKLIEAQKKANNMIYGVQAKAKKAAEDALKTARREKDRVVGQALQKVNGLKTNVEVLQKRANEAVNGVQKRVMDTANLAYEKATSALAAAQAAADSAEAKLKAALGGLQGAIDLVKANNFLAVNGLTMRVVVSKSAGSSAEATVDMTIGQNKLVFKIRVDMNNPSGSFSSGMQGQALEGIKKMLPDVAAFIN